jgi:hypothetical protein
MGIIHGYSFQCITIACHFGKIINAADKILNDCKGLYIIADRNITLKLVVCILLRVLGQVQGFRLTQHCFEYFIQ